MQDFFHQQCDDRIFGFTNFEPWPNSWRNRFLLQPKFGGCSDTIVFQQLFSHILWLYTHLKFKIIDTNQRWSWNMYLLSKFGHIWAILGYVELQDCYVLRGFFCSNPTFRLEFPWRQRPRKTRTKRSKTLEVSCGGWREGRRAFGQSSVFASGGRHPHMIWFYLYGCFLKWWYLQNTPKWSFLVGKPMVVGYHHFRKPPYRWWQLKCFFF